MLGLLEILVLAVSALVFAGTPSPVRGPSKLTSPPGAVGSVVVSRLAAAPGPLERWQRLRKRTILEHGAVEADVADEDIDERDDEREPVSAFSCAAIALRRNGAPREPERASRVARERDPSRFAIGRGISRGPPV